MCLHTAHGWWWRWSDARTGGRFLLPESMRLKRLYRRELVADLLTPVSAYLRLRQPGTFSFLLESVEGGERLGRYSFIGSHPTGRLVAHEGETHLELAGRVSQKPDVFTMLEQLSSLWPREEIGELAQELPRFVGGAVGYIGYEATRALERLPKPRKSPFSVPQACFGLYDTVIVFDHVRRLLVLLTLAESASEAEQRLDVLRERLCRPAPEEIDPSGVRFALLSQEPEAHQDRTAFEKAVRCALRYIAAGDIFQVVLSQRWSVPYAGDPFQVYRALRIINPSPYLFYLDFGSFQLFGSSPEVLVRVEADRVELLPIAGTRRRGHSPQEDAELEQELRADPKEQAEHVMLVDLGRNDLGRIAEPGSVRVERYAYVERYSHVMHLVSHLVARLRGDLGPVDALRACFPAGTVSGAPKVRAMEIIHELEPESRGPYAGAVGYLDRRGNLDMCIGIRSFLATQGRLFYQAGAGIVADSDPAREYEETRNKARALERALHLAATGLQL